MPVPDALLSPQVPSLLTIFQPSPRMLDQLVPLRRASFDDPPVQYSEPVQRRTLSAILFESCLLSDLDRCRMGVIIRTQIDEFAEVTSGAQPYEDVLLEKRRLKFSVLRLRQKEGYIQDNKQIKVQAIHVPDPYTSSSPSSPLPPSPPKLL